MRSKTNSLVTISIPIYNAERFLRDAIQSVINQTYKDWSLLLINDGSTDKSLSIMQEFEARDSRIKIIDDGQNKGLIARLNQSIDLTDTEYYARMDADDIMYITRVEEQVRFLEANKNVDVVGTSIMTIDTENRIIGSGLSAGKVDNFIHPTIMGHTEWFKKNPYTPWATRAEDFELWLRTSSQSVFWSLDKPLLFYREFGVPTLNKWLKTQKTLLIIFAHYRLYGKTLGWSLRNLVMTVVKICIYVFFSLIGKIDYVISKRRKIPIPPELCLTNDDLNISIKK